MIGAPGEGFKIAMATLDAFRATVGAAALGFARRALDETVARASKARAVRRPARRLADGAELHRRHGGRDRRCGTADLPRRLDQGSGRRARHARSGDGQVVRPPNGRRSRHRQGRCSFTAATAYAAAAATSSNGSTARSGRCRIYREEPHPKSRRSSSHGKRLEHDFLEHDHGLAQIARPHGTHRHVHPRQPPAIAAMAADPARRLPDYPEELNAGVELTDRVVARRFRRSRRPDRQRPPPHAYKELSDWTNRIAHTLVEDFGIKPGNRILIRSANNPAIGGACWLAATKAGAVVVNTMPMLRAGRSSPRSSTRPRSRWRSATPG